MPHQGKPKAPIAALLAIGKDRERKGYFVLCVLLAALLVLALAIPETPWSQTLIDLIFVFTLISAGYSVADSRGMSICVLGLGLLLVVLAVPSALATSPVWDLPARVAAAVFLVTVTVALLVDVVTGGHGRGVSPGLIAGATAVYLMIGLTYSSFYTVAYLIDPEAFRGAILSDIGSRPHDMLYFSFVTLSTLGYGDITPTNGLSQMLSITEALAGQLYLTILVARLVGMHIAEGPPHKSDGP